MGSLGDQLFRAVKRTIASEAGRVIGRRIVKTADDLAVASLPRIKAGIARVKSAASDLEADLRRRLQRHPDKKTQRAVPHDVSSKEPKRRRGTPMPADWKAILRHKAPELTRNQIDRMSDSEAMSYYYSVIAPREKAKQRPIQVEVCFTGFTVTEEDELRALATERGMQIRDSITKQLSILVTGPNAGPKKMEKAKIQGVRIVTEADFRAWLG